MVLVLVLVPVSVPTELTEYTEAYGLRNMNPQNGLRFARREFTEMKGIFRMYPSLLIHILFYGI